MALTVMEKNKIAQGEWNGSYRFEGCREHCRIVTEGERGGSGHYENCREELKPPCCTRVKWMAVDCENCREELKSPCDTG